MFHGSSLRIIVGILLLGRINLFIVSLLSCTDCVDCILFVILLFRRGILIMICIGCIRRVVCVCGRSWLDDAAPLLVVLPAGEERLRFTVLSLHQELFEFNYRLLLLATLVRLGSASSIAFPLRLSSLWLI